MRRQYTFTLGGVFSLVVFGLAGCGSNNSLPSTVVVELPDGTTVVADQGAGVAELANSSWNFIRTAGDAQGLPFATISFNADGALDAFDNNTMAQDILGSSVLFDGSRHTTSMEGLEYAASTFGAATNDGTGFAFEGRFTAFFFGLVVGEGEAGATGTFDPDDPDTITGTFSFSMEITVPVEIPGANQNESFPFVAQRVRN
jgi:hypothetical protein